MKKIEAYVSPAKFSDVIKALSTIDVAGVTMTEVWTRGAQPAPVTRFRGASATLDLAPQVRLELVVPSFKAEQVAETIRRAARTGQPGDGRVVVLPVLEVVRIRTGERGEDAL